MLTRENARGKETELGILLLGQMPASSVWFIGFAIGTDLFMDGSSLVVFATAIHSMPNVAEFTAGAVQVAPNPYI